MKMPKKKAQTFEEKLAKLAEIVDKVEDPSTSLDAAIALHNEGVALAKECGEALQEYEEQVVLLQKEADGFLTEGAFE